MKKLFLLIVCIFLPAAAFSEEIKGKTEYHSNGSHDEIYYFKNIEIFRQAFNKSGEIVMALEKIPRQLIKTHEPVRPLRIEMHYQSGTSEGTRKIYFANGQLFEEMHFKDNKPDGTTAVHSPDGQFTMEWDFKEGKLENTRIKYRPDIKSEVGEI